MAVTKRKITEAIHLADIGPLWQGSSVKARANMGLAMYCSWESRAEDAIRHICSGATNARPVCLRQRAEQSQR